MNVIDSEEWRPIPGAEGYYSVSNLGRVRSEPLSYKTKGRQRGRILSPYPDTKGYPIFRICIPGRRATIFKVHRAVAMAFIRLPNDGEQVNHKNGIKSDNRLVNLEYMSCRENIHHCWRQGLHGVQHVQGEANANTRLTKDDVMAIRCQYPKSSYGILARQYNVSRQTIRNIVKQKTWAHLPA